MNVNYGAFGVSGRDIDTSQALRSPVQKEEERRAGNACVFGSVAV